MRPAARDPASRAGDPVLASLAAVALAGAWAAGFLTVDPNRLQSGHAVSLGALGTFAAALATLPALASLALAARSTPAPAAARLALAVAGPAGILLASGIGAGRIGAHGGWIGLGGGFWIALACALLALAHVGRSVRRGGAVAGLGLALALAALASAGAFDRLSLAVEFRDQRAGFAAALVRHVELSAAAIGFACLVALPLGLLAATRPRLRTPLFFTLNVLQTIPSIAAFGLLIAPLSALVARVPALGQLGIGGIGPTPALIALTAYALLPIARNAEAGLAGVDAAVRDAGRGMGFSGPGLLARVSLPLALPAILAGIRVATVQTIGLATVAALIGAGGLGVFVFEGVGQYATDLVLLGALPVAALALAADALLGALERAAAP